MAKKSHSNRRGLKLSIITTVGLILIISLATLISGKVTGTEFAPTHFQKRTFTFREIPLIHLQVTPIVRTSVSSNLTNYLRSQNMLNIPSSPPAEWHLTTITRGVSAPVLGDSEILTSYLELSGGGGAVWEKWSRDNPEMGKLFWPTIQQLAERELYVMLPELFALAEQSENATELKAALDRYLPTAYMQLAQDLREANQSEMALGVLKDGLKDYPDDASLNESFRTLNVEGS